MEVSSGTSTASSSKPKASDAQDLKLFLPEPPASPGKLSLYGPKEMVLNVRLDAPDAKDLPQFQPVHVRTDFAQLDASGSVESHVVSMDLDLNIRASAIPVEQMLQYTRFRDNVLEKLSDFHEEGREPAPTPSTPPASPTSPVLSSSTDEQEARQLYTSALKAAKEGNYQAAVELLEVSTARDPHNSSAFNDLGRAYLSLNELPQAVVALRKATDVNPEDPYAFNNLGLALMREKKFDEALPAFKKQLEINPQDRVCSPQSRPPLPANE